MNRFATTVLRLALAISAGWALYHELDGVTLGSLAREIQAVGWSRLATGTACTILSFLLLGAIELLALRETDGTAGRRVPMLAALRVGFVANALSQSVGLSLLTGAAVRARAYARYGLDTLALAQTTAFVTVTATLGLLAAGAVALSTSAEQLSAGPLTIVTRPIAVALSMLVMAYLAWSVLGQGDGIGHGRWRLTRPTPALAVGQVVLSSLDWLVTGAVLLVFLPPHAGFTIGVVLGTYMIAQVAGVTSHVPAGAGVFEVVVIALLMQRTPAATRASIVAALVMFRLVYYLAPLIVAIVVGVLGELTQPREGRDTTSARERAVTPSARQVHHAG